MTADHVLGPHGHHHGPGRQAHAHVCGGPDHHQGDYTPQQRADLDLVLAFNRRMAEAIDAGRDVSAVEQLLDPDPLRYMWVDEGKGQIAAVITAAERLLDRAPPAGQHRAGMQPVPGSRNAARPSIATGPDGTRLLVWLEWVPGRGDLVRARVIHPDAAGTAHADDTDGGGGAGGGEVVSGGVADVFRPTALVSAAGVPWVFFGRRVDGDVGVWATRKSATGWSPPELVTGSGHPSFNQEAVPHRDGSVEVCWQGREETGFAIRTRRHADGAWGPARRVSTGDEANVWDPALAAYDDGTTAYAWSEFGAGGYRVVTRRSGTGGGLHPPRPLTSGSDYALHPHLAVTRDQRLWCAFDLITVAGHGGSGPTKLRPAAEVGADPAVVEGVHPGSANIPPELLPDVSASVRVVEVTDDGVREPHGELAPGLDVVPSGLPKLAATGDGGLAVAYRVHRKLPLMTYYWEVAVQVLGPSGWRPPTTCHGSDGTLEEVGVAPTATGVVVAAQTDARLQVALEWTEGFGGRECPYLHDHHGAVVWHGVHGVGAVVLAEVPSAGPVGPTSSTADAEVRAGTRPDARRWSGGTSRRERYAVEVGGRRLQLYWGDLHRHSLVSRCTAGDEPSLEDFYRYAWDVCEYDFWAVTDHSENSSDYQWWSIQKIADLFCVPGRFVPLYGFEWTSADSGHQNVIYGDVARGAPIFSAFAAGTTDPAGLWRALAAHPEFPAVTIPHHPGSAMVYNDWDYHDPRYSRLVEIFQACRGNYEAPGAFRQYSDATREGTFALDGLLRGHRFGFIGSSDHGHGASYVGAYAESLDRAAVFEALHERRTFAATTRGVLLDVRMGHAGGQAMLGQEVVTDGPRTLTVHAEGYADLARLDIVRNGVTVHTVQPEPERPQGHLVLPLRIEWGGAEVTTVWDGQLEVTGARILATPFWSPEVTLATPHAVAWRCTTTSFGEPYGSQRGGVELTVVGPPDATVRLRSGSRDHEVALLALSGPALPGTALSGTALSGTAYDVPGGPGHLRLQPGVGGLRSLGVTSLDLTWTDPEPAAAAFYYVRAFQVDGEMAWSSPIWVTPPAPAGGAGPHLSRSR